MFLFIPGNVFAEEYTFEIGNGKEWNESNLEELSERLEELSEQDREDHRYDNKYILNFADGDYDYSSYNFYIHGSFEYHFGVGNYNLGEMKTCSEIHISFYGTGIDKTKITTEFLGIATQNFIMENLTITTESFEFCPEGNDYNNSFADDSGILLKNIVLNYNSTYVLEVQVYGLENKLVFDNVKYNGIKTIRFENEDEEISKNAKIEFKNCDLSNLSVVSGGEIDENMAIPIYISNSKLNKIIEFGTKVIVDCDSTFVNGTTRKKISMDEFYELVEQFVGNEYDYSKLPDAIYELTYEYVPDGKVLIEVCKDKDAIVRKNISLKSIQDEFGFSIDKTWEHNPSGYVEVTDDIMIPYRPGIVKISKENNEELQTLRLNIKDQTFTNNVITNPQTGRNILILIAIAIISGFLIRKAIKRKA